jgi:predicted RNA methylase
MNIGKYQLKRCKYGWMLFHGPYIGKCFELYGQYSEAEVRIIQAFVGPGDTVVDVGASIGDLTVPMSLQVDQTGRVYAVESHSDTYNVLCSNLALNQITNTKAINAFIADSDQVDTDGPWGKHGFVSKNWQPPFLSIDFLGLESCAFIKIDVDGKELEVLRSAAETLARTRPVLYFENDVREKSPALLDHLMQADYTLYWHAAPIFEPENFYANPVNHWAPQNIVSLMVLGIPNEKLSGAAIGLRRVEHKDEWWDQVGLPAAV